MKCGSTLWLRQMAERGGHRGISRTEGAGLAERRDGRAEPDVHRSPSRMAPSPTGVGRSVTPSLLGGNGPLAPVIQLPPICCSKSYQGRVWEWVSLGHKLWFHCFLTAFHLPLSSASHRILSECLNMLGAVQGTQDMGVCQTPPFRDGDGAKGSDGCEDDGAQSKVGTGKWGRNTKFLGEEKMKLSWRLNWS